MFGMWWGGGEEGATFSGLLAELLMALAGTTALRSVMFLVFMSFVTFFSPEVTPSPLLREENTDDMSPLPPDVDAVVGPVREPAGGGGGGPGGPPAVEAWAGADETEDASPPLGFHATPVVWKFLIYVGSSLRKVLKCLTQSV